MEKIVVGNIAKPQGIRGEVKVTPLTDDPQRFAKLKSVFIDDKRYNVKGARVSQNGVFLSLENIDDRNTAELLRGKDIVIERNQAVKLPQDSYFIVDIIGCKVMADEQTIGKVIDVLQYGSADIYVIKTEDKKRAMIPSIKSLILDTDIVNKTIIVDKKVFDDLVVYED